MNLYWQISSKSVDPIFNISITIYPMQTLIRIITLLICIGVLAQGITKDVDMVGGDFSLTTHMNSTYSLSDSRGKVVLLFFGFTHCPDICPMTLSTIQTVLDQLGDQATQVQPLLITVDPRRDTPEILKNYLQWFGNNFIGLTGTTNEVDKVVKQYGGFYSYEGDTGSTAYNVDHTSNLYLIDTNGVVTNIMPFGLPPQAIVEFVEKLLAEHAS